MHITPNGWSFPATSMRPGADLQRNHELLAFARHYGTTSYTCAMCHGPQAVDVAP
ncbi:MAG TPA: hypothetical protein VEZ70_07810 [Allosphingosinicella sp.]|nr:hypothetical protein [Allosphingosinicella sp.]